MDDSLFTPRGCMDWHVKFQAKQKKEHYHMVRKILRITRHWIKYVYFEVHAFDPNSGCNWRKVYFHLKYHQTTALPGSTGPTRDASCFFKCRFLNFLFARPPWFNPIRNRVLKIQLTRQPDYTGYPLSLGEIEWHISRLPNHFLGPIEPALKRNR